MAAVEPAAARTGRYRTRPFPGAGASQYVPAARDGFAPAVGSERVAMAERQDGNSLLRSMPGTHSFHSRSQPGLQVNIRGMTGAGRVNTMIDGVTQTFRNNAGHGSGGPFAYVDPFLLAGVDVQRVRSPVVMVPARWPAVPISARWTSTTCSAKAVTGACVRAIAMATTAMAAAAPSPAHGATARTAVTASSACWPLPAAVAAASTPRHAGRRTMPTPAASSPAAGC